MMITPKIDTLMMKIFKIRSMIFFEAVHFYPYFYYYSTRFAIAVYDS